jgi:hypothetical protein
VHTRRHGSIDRRRIFNGVAAMSDLRLHKGGEYDNVREVMTGRRIKYSAAGNELERGVIARAIDEFVGERCLLVLANSDDGELEFLPILQGDVDPIAQGQLVQVEENGRAVKIVNVTKDDCRALLSRRSIAPVPTGFGEVRRDTHCAVLIESELGE